MIMNETDKKTMCDCENPETINVYKFNFNNLTIDEQIKVKGHLLELIGKAMQAVSEVRQYARKFDLLNYQEYLNFEDALNQISVADPNK